MNKRVVNGSGSFSMNPTPSSSSNKHVRNNTDSSLPLWPTDPADPECVHAHVGPFPPTPLPHASYIPPPFPAPRFPAPPASSGPIA